MIRFTEDKNGRLLAHSFGSGSHRHIKMSMKPESFKARTGLTLKEYMTKSLAGYRELQAELIAKGEDNRAAMLQDSADVLKRGLEHLDKQ